MWEYTYKMKIEFINPKELKFRENVRWRGDSNLSELMESIKHQGIQSPIKARAEDLSIVYGHRRAAAAIKLRLDKVPVILEEGIDDKKANILNLLENMQRKDVTSMEIGRQCDMMLKDKQFNISLTELATSLGVSERRVKICLEAFKSLPEKYRDKVIHLDNSRKRKFGDLPENVVFAILSLTRTSKERFGSKELDLLLKETGDKKLTVSHINLIGLLVNSGMPLKRALKELDLYDIARLNFILLRTELASVQKKEKVFGKRELFNTIIKKSYPNLVY